MTTTVDARAGAHDVEGLQHPLALLVEKISEALDGVAGGPPVWVMSAHEQRHTLRGLARIQAQLDAQRLLVLVQADRDGAALDAGASSAADWVAVTTRQRRSHSKADLRLGDTLCQRRHLDAAMSAGVVNLEQARVIARALDVLPRTGDHGLTWEQVEQAEAHLVSLAASFDAKALETLGAKIYGVICPEPRPTKPEPSRTRRNAQPGRPLCGCGATARASPTAGSPSRTCTATCSAKPSRPSPHLRDPTTSHRPTRGSRRRSVRGRRSASSSNGSGARTCPLRVVVTPPSSSP